MEKLTLKWYGIYFRPWVYRTLFIDNVMINLYDCMGTNAKPSQVLRMIIIGLHVSHFQLSSLYQASRHMMLACHERGWAMLSVWFLHVGTLCHIDNGHACLN